MIYLADENWRKKDRLEAVKLAYEKAKSEPCPYCRDLDMCYPNIWLERPQTLRMYVSEPSPLSYINETKEEKIKKHPELLEEHEDFRALICPGCGFTKLFRFPPF